MESHSSIALFLALGIIIAASRFAGGLARKFDQPRVLGELVIGVILGPTVIDLLHLDILEGAHLENTIKGMAELGVLILMFIVGLEVHLNELKKVGKIALIAGVSGAIIPVIMTIPVVMVYGYQFEPALFAGVTLAATSVSISAQVLFELGYLRTKEGNALLATALVDDVLAILLVSLTIALTVKGTEGDAPGVGEILVRMGAYFVIAGAIAWTVLPYAMNKLMKMSTVRESHGITAMALVFMLLAGWSAEEFGGVAAITGSFIAGVGLSRANTTTKKEIQEAMRYIAYGLLVPIFFVDVGLQTDLSSFPADALPFAMALLAAAVISKVAGSGLGAYWGGFTRQESINVGICMISRGEVGLIIASLGLSAGVFHTRDTLYPSLFLVIILTTVMTPPLVRLFFKQGAEPAQPGKRSTGQISQAQTTGH